MKVVKQSFIRKFSWYTVVGISAAVVYILMSLSLKYFFGFSALHSTGMGILSSALVSYFGHYYLTFLVKGKHQFHGLRFTIQVSLKFILNFVFINFLQKTLGLPLWLATTLFSILVPFVNFFVFQIYTFKENNNSN